LRIEITGGYVDPLDKALWIASDGARVLAKFAEDHPHLANLTLTALNVALSGPTSFLRDQVLDSIGVHDGVDQLVSTGKEWFSNQLQDDLEMTETYADAFSEAGAFGIYFSIGMIGGASKDKIIQFAKDTTEKVKNYTKHKEQPWVIRSGQEYKQKIDGKAQKTGTTGHEVRSYREAIKEAKKDEVEKVFVNRGYNRTIDPKIKPNNRPDVLVVRKNGKVDAIGVPSNSDSEKILRMRNKVALGKFSEERRGKIKIAEITKGFK
jgi:hypothetical protein